MSKIVDIRGREIIDSRGNPTVEVDLVLRSGAHGRGSLGDFGLSAGRPQREPDDSANLDRRSG